MQKKLFSGILLFLFLNLLIKPFWILGIDVSVQNAVGAEEFGIYFALFNFSFIFNILLDLGITNFNNKNIAQHHHLITKHLSGILGIKFILFFVFLAVTLVAGLIVGYNSRQFLLLLWMCFNQFLNSLILYLRSNFSGLLMFKTDSLLSILDRLLMIVFCSILLWGNVTQKAFQIEWFIGTQTLSYLITAAVALAALVHKSGIKKLTLNIPFSISIIKKSLPYAILTLLMASYNRIDPIMLERILHNGEGSIASGIYAGAYRLLDALVMLAYLVSVPLLPVYAKMIKEKKSPASITQTVFIVVFASSVCISTTLSGLSDTIMNLLYNSNTSEYASVFKILVFGFIPISITYVFGTLLTANGNLKELNTLSLITLGLNIGINILLIPRIQECGSAIASLSAQSFIAIAQIVVAFKIFKFKPPYRTIIQLLAYTAIVIASNKVFGLLNMHWIAHIACMAATMGLSLIALRLIKIKELIAMLKE